MGNSGSGSTYSITAIYIYAISVSIPGTGTVQVNDIWFNVNATNNNLPCNGFFGLYTDNGGAPQSLISSTTFTYTTGVNRAPLKDSLNSANPLYLPAGHNFWVAVGLYQYAAYFYGQASGSTPAWAGSSGAQLTALPLVLGISPATYVGIIPNFTMAAQLEYCQ